MIGHLTHNNLVQLYRRIYRLSTPSLSSFEPANRLIGTMHWESLGGAYRCFHEYLMLYNQFRRIIFQAATR
jgi:hypothetical protein